MILKICAVKDRAVDAFGVPFFVKSAGEAMRSFEDEVNRKESPFYAHPDDYDLYRIGEYDDASGLVTGVGPDLLSRGKDVINKE